VKTLGLAVILIVFAMFAPRGHGPYPSVADLETQLKLYPDKPLPQVVQGKDGTMYRVYYVEGKSRGNGYYDAVLRLEK